MNQSWRWAGACSVGSSHIRSGRECQDRASCLSFAVNGQEFISAVVSDGAGSASDGARGAAIVCSTFQRLVTSHLRKCNALVTMDDGTIADWMDEIRERINVTSARAGRRPRDYAATLVAAVIGPESAVIAHVGDGAAVLRSRETGRWIIPSWPFHGEYASTTRFVVDDPQATTNLVYLEGVFDRFAVFSDGLEYLVLDYRERLAPTDLFERFVAPLVNSEKAGRDRKFSRSLRTYLDGEKVREATDDDTSLILGART
jgi:hypothetical protein